MIFDVNCMVGKSGEARPDWPATSAEAVKALRRVGIDRALATDFASLQYDPVEGADFLADEIKQAPDFLAGCPVAVPDWAGDSPGAKELLDGYIEQDWRAFRIFPKTHYFLFHRLVVGELLEEAQARGFTVLINRDQFEYPELIDVLENFGKLKVVVCGEGYRQMRTIFALWSRFPELRFETSWIQPFAMYETVVNRFGAERLVFGSRFPTFEPGPSLTPILRADVPDEDRERILGGNLVEMLSEAH